MDRRTRDLKIETLLIKEIVESHDYALPEWTRNNKDEEDVNLLEHL